MLYHISPEPIQVTTFSPRIPISKTERENDTIPRICVAKSIKDCVAAVAENTVENLYDQKNRFIPFIYFVYEFDEGQVQKGNLISPHVLHENNWVLDAHITQEHWVINQDLQVNNSYCIMILNADVEHIEVPFLEHPAEKIKKVEYLHSHLDKECEFNCIFLNKHDFDIFSIKAEKLKGEVKFLLQLEGSYFLCTFAFPKGVDLTRFWYSYRKLAIEYTHFLESEDYIVFREIFEGDI